MRIPDDPHKFQPQTIYWKLVSGARMAENYRPHLPALAVELGQTGPPDSTTSIRSCERWWRCPQAHELLKEKFLRVDVVNPATGELVGQVTRSTTDLSTTEFADYCERCRAWLLDFFGIVTQDPDPHYAEH